MRHVAAALPIAFITAAIMAASVVIKACLADLVLAMIIVSAGIVPRLLEISVTVPAGQPVLHVVVTRRV